ncbi:conserved hypothetical protein [Nitrosococcus oceani ATCC 19707]|uniref:EVE domain-containing protein n=1 Tax=Nitrosococcus oceani (strain ATCC 19707 / BCRC 17464 / JCM 30415 / NCIMB 11848 / C-107) TaxID=323261 RepID=Q3JD87_NITOC|nr:hypothetical protein [Nitrosococcus oceani]ABA57209.1 conserved hypothetical protein [Nitrosococcus oceani ATCC 19707]GEM21534.1 hypothetical protein NONS58_29780 [Nitrosococcus oceani]
MKTWLVNTNIRPENGNPNAFKYMLRQNKAAAFYGRAVEIDNICRGDLVCLYHNDNRIIAVGAVVEPYQGHDFEEMELIEHWVDVNWLWKADFNDSFEPLNSIDRRELGIKMVNGTVINITDQVNYKELLTQIAQRPIF